MDKKKIIKSCAVFAVLLAAARAGTGTTLSYFTDVDRKVNAFATGDLDVDLREPEWDPEGEGDGKNLYPGSVVYKNPTVKNVTDQKKGPQPCYVRMIVDILDREGQPVTDGTSLELIRKTIYFDASYRGSFDKKGSGTALTEGRKPGFCLEELSPYPMVNPLWEMDTGRSTHSRLVFCYKGKKGDGILNPGEESTLFTNVVIPTDWTWEEIQAVDRCRLRITAQAVQCQGIAQASGAWEIMDQTPDGKTKTDAGAVSQAVLQEGNP